MSSLTDIVKAMSTEKENSTLGWDVVVNYTSRELNNLLQARHEQGSLGQLKDLSVQLPKHDDEGKRYTAYYNFKLGAPLIQFTSNGIDPSCSVKIPITGGTVKGKNEKIFTINPDVYTLLVSAVPLASANGTVGAERNPKDSDQPFIFSSPATTGIVTLNLGTAADTITVELQIVPEGPGHPEHVFLIDDEKGNLADRIKTQLRDPHIGGKITWDLGHVNNNLPSNNADNSLVPKSFRFAVYAADNKAETVLSLFIQTDDSLYGQIKVLQEDWISQWIKKYQVSPIASTYTASIIFNNRTITSLMNKSVQGMTIQKSPDQPTGDGLKLTVRTHKKYIIEGKDNITRSFREIRSKVNENLDDEEKALHITIGQNGNPNSAPSAQLNWGFTSSVKWSQWTSNVTQSGTVKITNKLEKTKSVDDSDLPNYLVHMDVSIDSSDWDKPDIKADETTWWEKIAGATDWKPTLVTDALPSSLPSVKVELINFNFFVTTNLLLPGSKMINFKKDPGARFPKDLYVVGHVATK
ncbi:hypothetical protein BYT27DRAFT_7153443 [Phlegmacium glaucopus]|nr:hypothetical protein BYT27DRAFT_7153443 [Phlegmacium glaucopus]